MRRLVIFLFCLSAVAACAQSHQYRQYTVNDGLPSATVYEVIQDKEGYIWAGTENGVTRFDGRTFQNFTREDGLTDNIILKLFQDSRGRIWFLPLNGKLCYYYKDKIWNAGNDPFLRNFPNCTMVGSPVENKKGSVFFETSVGLVSIDTLERLKIIPPIAAVPTDTFSIICHSDGVIWVQWFDLRYSNHYSEIQTNYYFCKGRYYKVADGQLTRVPPPYIKDPPSGSVSIQFYRKNTLWLCFPDQGAIAVKNAGTPAPVATTFLKGKNVSGVCEDDEGNIWFGTIGQGLWLLSSQDRGPIHYRKADGLPEEAVTVLHRDGNDIWAGSLNNILYQRTGGELKVHKVADLTLSAVSTFHDIAADANHRMYYVTSYDFGYLRNGTKPAVMNWGTVHSQSSSYKAIAISPDGRCLAITPYAICKYDAASDIHHSLNTQIIRSSKGRMFTACWTKNGTVWISDRNGLNELRNDSLIPCYSSDPILQEPISRIAELPDGNLIISTRTAGVILFDGKKVLQVFDRKHGLAGNICNRLRVDSNGVLVSTATGVSKLRYQGGKLTLERNFTNEDGLISNEVNDALIYNDSLYVATFSGLSIIPLNYTTQGNPPPVYIRKVIYDGKDITGSQDTALDMRSSSGNMQFSFIGITFQNPHKVEYLYRLSGSGDVHWYKNSTGQVDYTSLDPGNYVFEVKTRKINSAWSEPVRFAFHIRTPIWMQGWFQLMLYGMMITGIAVGGSAIARQKRKVKMRKLEIRDRMIQLEQQALSALMSPHFIFNALNSIQQYLHNNDALSANKYLSFFAKLTRRNMEAVMASEVRLDDELERLELYLQFEKLRFGDKLSYKIVIPDDFDAEEIVVPPMILQPFVENAIWHGLMPLPQGGEVIIRIYSHDENYFTVEISDNGMGIDVSREMKLNQGLQHKSKGMLITMERLELWCRKAGKKYSVSITQREGKSGQASGTLVKLELPYIA